MAELSKDLNQLVVMIAENEHTELFQDEFMEIKHGEYDTEEMVGKIIDKINEKAIGCSYCEICEHRGECHG